MGAPFLWSWSRHRLFSHCQREYWFHYYGARNGWRPEADPRTAEIYRLKKLSGRSQWLGLLVHEAAATVLRGLLWRRPEDEAALRATLLADARQAIAIARGQAPAPDRGPPVRFLALELGEDPGDAGWEETLADLALRFDDLMVHPVMRRLRQVPGRMIEIDRLRKVRLDGLRLYVAPDVLVDDGEGGRVIVDWKTGRSHDPEVVARQMAVYAWWVAQYDGIPVDRIKGLQANVPGREHLTVSFDSTLVDAVRSLATESIAAMVAPLPDPRRDQAPESAFEPRPVGDPACDRCRFRGPCGRADPRSDPKSDS